MIKEASEGMEDFHTRTLHWLVSSPIRGPAGEIYSWINPLKSGYIYPEIMGYYTKLLSYFYRKTGKGIFLERALQTAENLVTCISRSGAVSRGGVEYVLDSAICISGLIAVSRVAGTQKYRKPILALSSFVSRSLQNEVVAFKDGIPAHDNGTWSLSLGASTLKACIALQEAADFLGDGKLKELSDTLLERILMDCFRDGAFTINQEKPWIYTHPHCYATEALLYLQAQGYDLARYIDSSAEWLAKNQNEDGSLYGWYGNPGKPQEKQGDATAQAIRIWLCTNREKYKENIRKAWDFLKGLQAPDGGLLYNQGSQDVNSWVTIFASQAAWWLLHGPEPEGIV